MTGARVSSVGCNGVVRISIILVAGMNTRAIQGYPHRQLHQTGHPNGQADRRAMVSRKSASDTGRRPVGRRWRGRRPRASFDAVAAIAKHRRLLGRISGDVRALLSGHRGNAANDSFVRERQCDRESAAPAVRASGVMQVTNGCGNVELISSFSNVQTGLANPSAARPRRTRLRSADS